MQQHSSRRSGKAHDVKRARCMNLMCAMCDRATVVWLRAHNPIIISAHFRRQQQSLKRLQQCCCNSWLSNERHTSAAPFVGAGVLALSLAPC